MFVQPVARQKSRANAPKRPTDAGLHGPILSEHGELQPGKADASGHGAGQALDFGKIPLFSRGSVDSGPAKLRVGAVNDPMEHEADHAADQALRIPEAGVSSSGAQPRTGSIRPRLRAEAAAKPLKRDMA